LRRAGIDHPSSCSAALRAGVAPRPRRAEGAAIDPPAQPHPDGLTSLEHQGKSVWPVIRTLPWRSWCSSGGRWRWTRLSCSMRASGRRGERFPARRRSPRLRHL